MVISGTSPDRNIRARVSNYTQIEIEANPGVLDRYDEEQLGHQLARLAATTWVGYHRGRAEAYRRARGFTASELAEAERPSDDPKQRRYEEELNRITGEGLSAGRAVRIRTTGLMEWKFDIQRGSVRRLGGERLLAEINSAAKAWLGDREMKIILLKAEYFDLGLPRKWRELATRLQIGHRRH
ncbi:MAG: hypothetical protein WCA46_16115 [Actinocatenispora sp.]